MRLYAIGTRVRRNFDRGIGEIEMAVVDSVAEPVSPKERYPSVREC